MTIIEIGKKLSVINYIFDRVSKIFTMPSLANLVAKQVLP